MRVGVECCELVARARESRFALGGQHRHPGRTRRTMNQGEVEAPELFGPEQLVLCHDDEVGLRAVIAVDDTTLGPALGGVRFRAYANDFAGVIECQRLAAAMTLKNAVAELP